MASEDIQHLEFNGEGPIRRSLLLLHGLGANNRDLCDLAQQLACRDLRILLPQAPSRPVSLNGGMVMPAWFDLADLNFDPDGHYPGFVDSVALIRGYIEQEKRRNIPYHNILLGGFSQGGCVALHTALQQPHRLAGAIGLSTCLPRLPAAAFALPIFLAHGTQDPTIDIRHARHCHQALLRAKHRVSWHEYPIAHALCHEEIEALRHWMEALTTT